MLGLEDSDSELFDLFNSTESHEISEDGYADEDALSVLFDEYNTENTEVDSVTVNENLAGIRGIAEHVEATAVGAELDISMEQIPDAEVVDSSDYTDEYEEEEEDTESKKILVANGVQNQFYTNDSMLCYLARISYSYGMLPRLVEGRVLDEDHINKLKGTGITFDPDKDLLNASHEEKMNAMKEMVCADLSTYQLELSRASEHLSSTLQTNSSRTPTMSSSDFIVQQLNSIQPPNGLPSSICEVIIKIGRQARADNDDNSVSSQKIFSKLVILYPNLAQYLKSNVRAVLSYIDIVISTYDATSKDSDIEQKDARMFSRTEARTYLLTEQQALRQLQGYQKSGRLYFITQLICEGDKFYYYCPECGEKVLVDDTLVRVLIIPIVGTQNRLSIWIPKAIKCGCGAAAMLNGFDIAQVKRSMKEYLSKTISKYNEVAATLSSRAPISHFTLSAMRIRAEFEKYNLKLQQKKARGVQMALFVDGDVSGKGDEDDADDTEITQEHRFEIHLCSDDQYLEAVKTFYAKLQSTNPRLHSVAPKEYYAQGHFKEEIAKLYDSTGASRIDACADYSYVARLVCSTLGLSYVEFKNRAVVSLIFLIKENKLLNEMMSYEQIWEIEKTIRSIQQITEYSNLTLPSEMCSDLIMLYSTYSSTTYAGDADSLFQNKEQILGMLEFLRNKLPLLQEEHELLINRRKSTLGILKKCASVLRFTKIINVNTVKFADMSDIIGDNETLDFVNSMADQMIVCNFANKFYSKWMLLSSRKSGLVAKLNNSKDNLEATRYSNDYVESLRAMLKSQDDWTEAYGLFSLATNPTTAEFEYVRDAELGIKKIDPFTVGEALPDDVESIYFYQLGSEFGPELEKATVDLKSVFHGTPETTPNEAALLEAGFSREEIDSSRMSIDIDLERFLLIRKEGERLEDYVARARKFNSMSTIEKFACEEKFIDYLPQFIAHAKELCMVALTSNLITIGYDNFIQAAFMVSLIDVCVNCMHLDKANQLLAVSETIGRKLAKKEYNISIDTRSGYMMEHVFNSTYFNELDYLVYSTYNKYNMLMLNMTEKITDDVFCVDDMISDFSDKLERMSSLQTPITVKKGDTQQNQEVMYDVIYESLIDSLQKRVESCEGHK